MRYEVRQLSFGEILDQAFKVLKDHFVLLTSIMAVLYIPYSLLMSFIVAKPEPGVPPAFDMKTMLPALVGMLIMLLVLPLTQLAMWRAVSEAYLRTAPTLGQAYSAALKLYMPYVLTFFLAWLALVGLTLLFVIPGVYFGVCWFLVGPVAVVEGTFGTAAMKRSKALTKGQWWRTLGVLFVAFFLAGIVSSGVNMVVSSIPVVGAVITGAAQSVSAAFGSVVMLVLYVDLRCRHEDFDLQLLAQHVTGQAAPAAGVQSPVGT